MIPVRKVNIQNSIVLLSQIKTKHKVENECQWLQQTMQIHFDLIYDKFGSTNPN